MKKKNGDGVNWKRGAERRLIYYWRIGKEKSKDYLDPAQCAQDYVKKYVDRNPKYEELVLDKTWEEIYRIFGIVLPHNQ